MKNFLFEIGTEEIPAGAMPKIIEQVETLTKAYLKEERLSFKCIKVLGTPRRIALLINELADRGEDLKERHKGPSTTIAFDANNNPTKAAIGFARGKGLSVEELLVEDGYIYADTLTAGKDTKSIVEGLLPHIVDHLSFPKSMRWGNYEERFIRPIRWFVVLLDEEVISFERASAVSSNMTRGHRFLGDKEFAITSPTTYIDQLREEMIIVDQDERKTIIVEQLEAIAHEQKGRILWDDDLLEEVVYLVEYPTALSGTFDASYLMLPRDAVITPMKDHQRYFPMVDADDKLMATFLTVRNGNKECIDIVKAGNERVLRARLEDARFFFDEDRKRPLIDRLEDLKKIVFQEGLGSMHDKTNRLLELGAYMANLCGVAPTTVDILKRATLLAKTDLPTGMVTEFTELQGIMGREYALLDGESTEVSEAILEQYLPRFAGDTLPLTEAGKILSIVDKIDNIVATFSRGLIPTGSQDPYALRRQTIGVLQILMHSSWNISLGPIFVKSATLLGIDEDTVPTLLDQLMHFFTLRLKNMYLDRKWDHEVIDLLLSRKDMTVYANELLAQALTENKVYKATDLVQAFTRTHNLVKDIELMSINKELFVHDSEMSLYHMALAAHTLSQEAVQKEDYRAVLEIPATLVDPINYFFDSVMIMDKDEAIKNNRLQLLRLVYEVFAPIGEIDALK